MASESILKNENINNKLFVEIKNLVERSKQEVAVTVNATMTQLYRKMYKRRYFAK